MQRRCGSGCSRVMGGRRGGVGGRYGGLGHACRGLRWCMVSEGGGPKDGGSRMVSKGWNGPRGWRARHYRMGVAVGRCSMCEAGGGRAWDEAGRVGEARGGGRRKRWQRWRESGAGVRGEGAGGRWGGGGDPGADGRGLGGRGARAR